jgi:probable F420-dependent oxidoreductase
MTMRYGVHVNSGAAVTDPSVLRDLGQVAEELGYESILIGDHVVPPRKITTPFPLKMEHPPWQVYQEQPWPDCFVMLSFLAAATKRVRLGTSVIILPYRHPAVVAKMLAPLDRLSGGRVICGVGIGWLREEFGFLGVPFAERAAMSDEYVAVMKALWTNVHPRCAGHYVTIDQDVNFGPLPVQKPHPPIWVGGNTLPALRRVARWGDGWQPVYLPLPMIQQKLGQLRALMEEAGRDFRQLEISTLAGANVTAEEANAYQAAGIHTLYLLTTSDKPQELFAQVRQFAGTLRALADR